MVISVTTGLLLLYNYYTKHLSRKVFGRELGKRQVLITVRRFASSNGFRCIEPVKMTRDDQTANLDAVVVGYFGVLGVISLGYNGQVYGEADDDEWVQVGKDKTRHYFQNPIKEAATAARVLRDVLVTANFKKVPVEVIYVFNNQDVQLAIPPTAGHFTPSNFRPYLSKDKFLKDVGLDLDAVEQAIRTAAQGTDAPS